MKCCKKLSLTLASLMALMLINPIKASAHGYGHNNHNSNCNNINNGWCKNTDNTWCYYDSNVKCSGWKHINGNWYCFNNQGNLYTNCVTPDGYKVDHNGAWIS